MGNNVLAIGKLSFITLVAAWLIFLYAPTCFGETEEEKSFYSVIKGDKFSVGYWKQIQTFAQTQPWAKATEIFFMLGYSRGFESGLTLGVSEYGKVLEKCYAERNFSGQEIEALLAKYSTSGASAFADDVKIQAALFFTIMKACNLIIKEAEPFRDKAK
jgi:hypothetical protein